MAKACSTNVLIALRARWVNPAKRLLWLLGCSDEDEAPASLPPSEREALASEGATVLKRVDGGMLLGASKLEGPVSGDKVNDAVVLDIVPVVRCAAGRSVKARRQQRNLLWRGYG